MKKLNTPVLVSGLLLAVLSGNTFGEAGISYSTTGKPAPVTANAKFKITIPQIMILRVGDWGDTVNTVEWNYAFGAGLSTASNATAIKTQWDATDTVATPTSTNNELQVAAFGNVGIDLTLESEIVSDFDTDNDPATVPVGGQPLLSDVTAVGTAGGIDHPAWGTDVSVGAINGVVRKTDTWTYTYAPTVVPVGGVYTAEVQYTLAAI